jgi:ParB family chromosome partitioning protein
VAGAEARVKSAALVRSTHPQRRHRRLEELAATANRAHDDAVHCALDAGRALLEAKKLVGHGQWRQWLSDHCKFSERTAQVYMQAARNPQHAADSLRQLLGALKKPGRYAYVGGDVEWYTPKPIVDAARQVLGAIDLDPASCTVANTVVGATRFFSHLDDGLQHPWAGRVFLNPPYSSVLIHRFIDKLVAHVQDASVPAAIVVVNSETEVKWFGALSAIATAVCFPTGRLKFWKLDSQQSGPLGQAIVYVGAEPETFRRSFRWFGKVWFA